MKRHAFAPLVLRLQHDGRLDHLDRRGIGGGVGAAQFPSDAENLGRAGDHAILPREHALHLGEARGRNEHRHEEQASFIERRHEFATDAGERILHARKCVELREHRARQADCERERGDEQQRGEGEDGLAAAQRPVEDGIINAEQRTHHPVVLLAMERPAHEQRAEHGHDGHREDRGADHREGLCECERVEKFPFLPGEREHRDKREDDDRHREEDRAADLLRGLERHLPGLGSGEAIVLSAQCVSAQFFPISTTCSV